mmetsp:Transcript_2466/g.9629  ORF Transcript_2466/g.9629 Transcript_2466/m.9629 type:complete len:363 (+) Transcript_2466:2179-3267(+)
MEVLGRRLLERVRVQRARLPRQTQRLQHETDAPAPVREHGVELVRDKQSEGALVRLVDHLVEAEASARETRKRVRGEVQHEVPDHLPVARRHERPKRRVFRSGSGFFRHRLLFVSRITRRCRRFERFNLGVGARRSQKKRRDFRGVLRGARPDLEAGRVSLPVPRVEHLVGERAHARSERHADHLVRRERHLPRLRGHGCDAKVDFFETRERRVQQRNRRRNVVPGERRERDDAERVVRSRSFRVVRRFGGIEGFGNRRRFFRRVRVRYRREVSRRRRVAFRPHRNRTEKLLLRLRLLLLLLPVVVPWIHLLGLGEVVVRRGVVRQRPLPGVFQHALGGDRDERDDFRTGSAVIEDVVVDSH